MFVAAIERADGETAPAFRPLELARVTAFFVVATIVMTWPVWRHPSRALPSDLVDTLLNTWIIGWDADRLRHGLQGLWDAPIFFPYRNTLAFSEHLLGVAVFVAPIYWVTQNAVLTYNVALTMAFTVCGVGMYVLATALAKSRRAGLVAGVFYAFCPFHFIQLSHLQLIATGWLPLGLYGLHRYFMTGTWQSLAVFAAACWLQIMSNSYAAYLMILPVGVIVVDGLSRERALRRPRIIGLAVTALLIVVALLPVVLKYYQVRLDYGQVRRLVEIEMGSADVRAYFIGDPSLGMWRWLRAGLPVEPERELFPGLMGLVLAGVALWSSRRNHDARRWVLVYVFIAVGAVALSLGPHPTVWGRVVAAHGPFEWFVRVVPGADGMRVPARFALIVFLALSVLGAIGARAASMHLPRSLRSYATAACIAVMLAESWAAPVPVYSYPAGGRAADRGVAEWLRDRPSGGVLHLPVRTNGFQELHYQYATLTHSHPIVNGMSGYDTPLQRLFREAYSPLYDADRPAAVVRMLRGLGVRYVVVHVDDYNLTQHENNEDRLALGMLRASGQVVAEHRVLDAYAFELESPLAPPPGEPVARVDLTDMTLSVSDAADRAPHLVDRDADTRWFGRQDGTSWIAIDLARPRGIARVVLQLAERSIADYPRELTIEATDARGVTRTLYHATPYAEFISAFVREPNYPRMAISLPPNETAKLTIRETGDAAGRWWSVHEIELWQRRSH
jgi:hypothetical protein